MKSRKLTALSVSAAAVSLALALLPGQASLAQDTPQKVADAAQPADQVAGIVPTTQPSGIRVPRTGSNIVRVRTDGSLPLSEYDRTYIDRTGASTTSEMLRTIPQVQIGR
jgi:hypothetical protein